MIAEHSAKMFAAGSATCCQYTMCPADLVPRACTTDVKAIKSLLQRVTWFVSLTEGCMLTAKKQAIAENALCNRQCTS